MKEKSFIFRQNIESEEYRNSLNENAIHIIMSYITPNCIKPSSEIMNNY
jgi:hypothetical protein